MLEQKIALAIQIMATTPVRDLNLLYSDWFDWEDFLKNGTGKETAVEYLTRNAHDMRDFEAFLNAINVARS